jgi:hypothetical protein
MNGSPSVMNVLSCELPLGQPTETEVSSGFFGFSGLHMIAPSGGTARKTRAGISWELPLGRLQSPKMELY